MRAFEHAVTLGYRYLETDVQATSDGVLLAFHDARLERVTDQAGDVSLMITKHCVRYSLSLCPKQAKGVTGVQGTVRAAPLTLINGSEKLTLRFDCKPCEMHVVGKLKPAVAKNSAPLTFYRTRP